MERFVGALSPLMQVMCRIQRAARFCQRSSSAGVRSIARTIPQSPAAFKSAHIYNPASEPRHLRRLSLLSRQVATFSVMAAAVTAPAGGLTVDRVNCLKDNYVWILREPSGETAVVDPSEAAPVIAALSSMGVKPRYIFNTHHHWDHTGGNVELKDRFGLTIVGPKADEDRIPGIDVALGEGDEFPFGQLTMRVFDTPGHTRGHITLYFPDAAAVFPGDTLFAMGCGRLFEGTPQQMWDSLSKIKALPPQTAVYCAHEYTQANAKWAVAVNPNNKLLQDRQQKVIEMRKQEQATIPSTLEEELRTNPFLRPQDPDIRKTLGLSEDASDLDVFTGVRRHKDNF